MTAAPWDGFVIEYAERARRDDSVGPDARQGQVEALYLLNEGETAYVWVEGVRSADPQIDPTSL